MTSLVQDEDVATYLGQKGYTIKKENMMIQEQNLIKKELMMKPFVPKNSLAKPNSFPVCCFFWGGDSNFTARCGETFYTDMCSNGASGAT